ncbi:ferredoxin--nitrite reductase, chloroplastic [Ricinus communis]|uniref:Ferredoxin--nitrite reductase, chloroplastic n=1 Tax=Ricinus communis TaxID=3988 RepID=B9RYH9_RICCO|nr:ferredoxin--nitrite reductase, chloroplastic [Ricinus communis]EEF43688.1 Ferredoxin--nitrite reductase, chloroplast precursor, putative [Ricinus communis]|eukprot:XP_002518763.1 ferredoxin--nitrite reductase, chloroplastic [Ricinus communis]
MSSLPSVRLLSPPLSSHSTRPTRSTRIFAAGPTVVQPVEVQVDAERLEPRVEEKDGYFVLKEKFRQGINPQEKVKIEKEPMKLFMENGIEELAKLSMEEIDQNKLTKDDIDVRLKWLGLFHRRKQQYGRFMMRLKLPNGVTTSEQTRYLASVIRKYGKDGCADVTTRQNWQIRGVVLSDVPDILKGLAEVGLTSLQSGMDNVRNPVGNPLAGIDPEEIVDTRPYTNLLTQFLTSNSQGNPAVSNLPRKWNVCVIGSHDLYEHPHINDLAYMPATKDGRFGFNLLVGGFFSAKRCAEAIPLDAWVSADDVIPVCKAVLEAYRDLGFRGNRQKTRMMWLIDEIGLEGFRSEVERRMPQQKLERASSEDLVQKQWERRDYFGVHPQSQEGFSYVGIHIPVGRVQADDMDELARLADTYGSGELRLTVEQNIIIPNIENSKIEALLQEPLLKHKFSPEPPILMKGLVACTGNEFCGQAIIETKARAMKVTEEVQRLVSVTQPVRMHWTGCPNTCGQVQVADIGFMGCMTRDENGKVCEGVDVFLGGRIGSDSHLGDVYKKSVPCKNLVPLVVDILVNNFGAVPREREELED